MTRILSFTIFFLSAALLGACTHNEPVSDLARQREYSSAPSWQNLSSRLQNDGFSPEELAAVFAALRSPSPAPMSVKIKELYTSKFLPKPKAAPSKKFSTELGVSGPWFKGVVTRENARKCRTYMNDHARAFARAERTYGVPSEVAAALLFVETRLGGYLGKHEAFHTLASMAVSREPSFIRSAIATLKGAEGHIPWIQEKMNLKADWAYQELKALLSYCRKNSINPLSIKGSIYGAIGLCQFMPSNIALYGADGNDDGIINLFDDADAIASLSRYLKTHGWKPGLTIKGQAKVLKSYNNMDIYAHTILALAESIRRLH